MKWDLGFLFGVQLTGEWRLRGAKDRAVLLMLKPGLRLIDMHAKSKHHLALFIDRQFAAPSLQFAN